MEECLAYFRQALADPLSVPPWSEWWAANAGLVERSFPRAEYLRLKYRRLTGAALVLANAGETVSVFRPSNPLDIQSCPQCGERTTHRGGPGGGCVSCPACGVLCLYDCVTNQTPEK
jgi:hypothetical protein